MGDDEPRHELIKRVLDETAMVKPEWTTEERLAALGFTPPASSPIPPTKPEPKRQPRGKTSRPSFSPDELRQLRNGLTLVLKHKLMGHEERSNTYELRERLDAAIKRLEEAE